MIVVFDSDLVLDSVTPELLDSLREGSRDNVIVFTTNKKFKELDEKLLSKIRMPTKTLWFVLAEGGRHCLLVRYIETKCLWQDQEGGLDRLLSLRGYDKSDIVPFT